MHVESMSQKDLNTDRQTDRDAQPEVDIDRYYHIDAREILKYIYFFVCVKSKIPQNIHDLVNNLIRT